MRNESVDGVKEERQDSSNFPSLLFPHPASAFFTVVVQCYTADQASTSHPKKVQNVAQAICVGGSAWRALRIFQRTVSVLLFFLLEGP